MGEKIRLAGHTQFTRNNARQLLHATTIEVEDGAVTTTVTGIGDDCESHPPVTTDNPAVEQYIRDVDHALQVTAYRNRRVTPIFKPERKRRRAATRPDPQQ